MPAYKIIGTQESSNMGFESIVEASSPQVALIQFFRNVDEGRVRGEFASIQEVIDAVDPDDHMVDDVIKVIK